MTTREDNDLGIKKWLTGPGRKTTLVEVRSERVVQDRHRIAVLPFANMSPDPNDSYFADGMTEEMISTLSGIHDLSVISRTSVTNYKAAKKNLADIGRELRTATVLEGSVRKAGTHVRITVKLLDVNQDMHLWAQTYDRELQDIFAVQSDIAKSVAEAVKVELLATTVSLINKKPTTNTEAYLQYLKGRQEWNKRTEESTLKAIEYFTQALDHDKNFALAHVGLADSNISLVYFRGTSYNAGIGLAKTAVLKALQLDKKLADAHATYGRLLEYEWDWESSEKEYEKAIEFNPSYAAAHSWYSDLLQVRGRLEKSLTEAQRALELDPLSAAMTSAIAFNFLFMERWDEAIEYYERALAIRSEFPADLVGLSLAYSFRGDYGEAIAEVEKFTRNDKSAWGMIWLVIVQALVGRKSEALSNLDRALKLPDSAKIPPTWVAHAFAALGDEGKTFELLELALQQHDPSLTGIKYGPVFKGLRSRPRFLKILRKIGIENH